MTTGTPPRDPSTDERAGGRFHPYGTGLVVFAGALTLLGLVARLRAATFPAASMFRSFPTEDGYLMLTVARNLALGRGMTSAAGTIATDGSQPLATLLQAAGFWLMGGDRAGGVRLLIVVYTLVALVTAILIQRLGLRLLGATAEGRRASLVGAAVWFFSPATLFHTMNMLETGLYAGFVVAVALMFTSGHATGNVPWPWSRCFGLGGLLGAAFWARNDAVFLMAAVGLAHLLTSGEGVALRRRLGETAAMAASTLAVSFPWLLYCRIVFGSIVPVSGQAHVGPGSLAANLSAAAVALFEHATLVASFEFNPLQHWGPFAVGCALVLAVGQAVVAVRLLRRRWNRVRAAVFVMPWLLAGGLLIFYVLFFDAPHFLRRYLVPLSPFLALFWGTVALHIWNWLRRTRLRFVGPILLLLLVVNFSLRNAMTLAPPWNRGVFFRSVEWVEDHLPEETWVGAFQSGTLGFFHDRTINLDGKINPYALAAIKRGRHQVYVADSPVEYVVDWASIIEPWSRSTPVVRRHFEWVVLDEEHNFAVLGRRGSTLPEAHR